MDATIARSLGELPDKPEPEEIDRAMAEEAFRAWWEELEAVLDKKPDGVTLMSLDGYLRAFDPDELVRFLGEGGLCPDAKAEYYGYVIDGGGT